MKIKFTEQMKRKAHKGKIYKREYMSLRNKEQWAILLTQHLRVTACHLLKFFSIFSQYTLTTIYFTSLSLNQGSMCSDYIHIIVTFKYSYMVSVRKINPGNGRERRKGVKKKEG